MFAMSRISNACYSPEHEEGDEQRVVASSLVSLNRRKQRAQGITHHRLKGTIPSCQDTKRVAYRMDAFIMVKEEINTWVLTIYIGKLEIPVEKSNVLRHSVGSFRKSELWFGVVQFFYSC